MAQEKKKTTTKEVATTKPQEVKQATTSQQPTPAMESLILIYKLFMKGVKLTGEELEMIKTHFDNVAGHLPQLNKEGKTDEK
jgi:hypothetical protein